MKVYLVYNKFIDDDTKKPTIGGIQTYIKDLCELLIGLSHDVIVIQQSNEDRLYSWNNISIRSLRTKNDSVKSFQTALSKFFNQNLSGKDLVIFMTHTLSFDLHTERTITIQHGIYWDVPANSSKAPAVVEFFFRNMHAWKDLCAINKSRCCVAVDYNFLNWYKTQQYYMRSKIEVIPNYCRILENYPDKSDNTIIRILFARRFEIYRGTRLFSEAIDSLLLRYDNIQITFAGTGPEEEYLRGHYQNNKRVDFITYEPINSMTVHSNYDIAVVASTGSEGTSLSLLEAMGAGCAVLSTNVGGLTNIIINRYNGIMTDITSESLYKGLCELIENAPLRHMVAMNGYNTVKSSFNKERWNAEWASIIQRYD